MSRGGAGGGGNALEECPCQDGVISPFLRIIFTNSTDSTNTVEKIKGLMKKISDMGAYVL